MYTIRALKDVETLRRCERVQRAVWGLRDRQIVPSHQLFAAVAAGGIVVGAFDPKGKLVGFSYAFPGRREGRPLFYSHMTAVLAEHRGRGVGFRLKCAQREAALAAGVDRIVWTFDPLQVINARLNLNRLGAQAARYYPDYCGVMPDALSKGLPSDRFEVDWFLRSLRCVARIAGDPHASLPPGLPWGLEADEPDPLASPCPPHLHLNARRLLIEVPPDIAQMKAAKAYAAISWREATRAAFLHYFGVGYVATDVITVPRSEAPRVAYLLERKGDAA